MAQKSLSVQRTLTRAASHAKKGEPQQAYQLYKAVLDKFPKNAPALSGIAGLRNLQQAQRVAVPPQAKIDDIMRLYQAKRYDQALGKVQALVKIYPRFQGLYNIAGVILAEVGQWENATKAYQQALGLKPDYAEAHYNYAISLEHLKRTDEAITSLRNAVQADPDYAEAHNNLGNYLKDQGKMEDAIASYQRAIEIKPDFVTAHANAGNCYNYLGHQDKAIACYEKAIEIEPDFIKPHLRLGNLIKYKAGDPRIAKLESFLEGYEGEDKTKVQLHFGLAKAYEDVGDIETTFEHLSAGNSLRKDQKEYTTQMDAGLIADIKSYFSADILATKAPPNKSKSPIFIVGMPRSGTTLSEQILASHSKVFGAGEMSAMGNVMKPELTAFAETNDRKLDDTLRDKIRTGYLDALDKLDVPESIIVDKMPLNFLWVGFILAAFPDAKVINLNRDPVATGWSIFKYNFSSSGNRYAHDLRDIGEFYNLYTDMMAFWRETFPGKIYDLNYEALTEDQEGETRKLLEYCGLDWEAGCLDFHKSNRAVKTVSGAQVRKKMYKGSSQAWRKYEKHLGPLLDALDYKVT
jgi:tetratricopeptide (TPR) repeat protein